MRDPTPEELSKFQELQTTIILYHFVGIVGVCGTLINVAMFITSPSIVFLICGIACAWITYDIANRTAEQQNERDKFLEGLRD